MHEYLLRRACDRCHTQKLRCEREGDVCARCARAGATCIWSPSLRKQPVRRSESRSPTELSADRGGVTKRKRIVAPSLSPSSYSSIQSHLINDQRSHDQFDCRDMRNRPSPLAFERGSQPSQSPYNDFNYNALPAQPSVRQPNAFDGLPEATQYWSSITTEPSMAWTPTYVSSTESSSVASTATDASLYGATNLTHQSNPYLQSGIVAPSKSAIQMGRENSAQLRRALPLQLALDTTGRDQATSTIQQLSALNVQLHENASRITAQRAPSIATPQQPRGQRSRSTSLATGGHRDTSLSYRQDLAIDETFYLSLNFIDILCGKVSRPNSTASPPNVYRGRSTSVASSCPSAPATTPVIAEFASMPQPPLENMEEPGPSLSDQASVLLVLSCYLRLINTFNDIFEHIQAVLEASKPNEPRSLRLKRISIGDICPPKESLAQVNLVLQMSESLLACVRARVRSASASDNDEEAHMGLERSNIKEREESPIANPTDVTKMTHLAIKVREVNIINKLKRIRSSLHQPSIFV